MKKLIIVTILLFGSFITAVACLWDEDTIEMERQQFPSAIELISGKFLRHSPEFYAWRLKDRKEKLNKFPDSLALYDDLAVSYSKIGFQKKAIEVILKKDSIQSGQYKTYANLGTFLLHDGQLKKGLVFIEKAIDINPLAHFGREVYQKLLAEYMLSKMDTGEISFPLDPTFPRNPYEYYGRLENSRNFYSFLLNKYKTNSGNLTESDNGKLPAEELEKAVTGIMGMMKFGDYTSPVLLETLGDLLLNTGDDDAARQLAARAYLKASYQVNDYRAEKIYRKKVEYTIRHQLNKKSGGSFTIQALEELLKEEIKEGDQFYRTIRDDEISWIESGKDPEQAFAEKYYDEPKVSERVQHSDRKIGNAMDNYANDNSIGKIVDYRSEGGQEKIKSSKDKGENGADSSARKLIKELRGLEKPDANQQKSFLNNNKNLFFGSLALLIVLAGGIYWYKQRRKIKG